MKFSVKFRDIHKLKIEIVLPLATLQHRYDNKEISNLCVKTLFQRHFDLSLIVEEGKRNYVLIKYFNSFMYDHALNRGRKQICRYCSQDFSIVEILKSHINDCFKINGKQMFKIPKRSGNVRFKNYERKIKSPFMIYTTFEVF